MMASIMYSLSGSLANRLKIRWISGCSVATVEDPLHFRSGQKGRQVRELPSPDGGHAAGKNKWVQSFAMEISEKCPPYSASPTRRRSGASACAELVLRSPVGLVEHRGPLGAVASQWRAAGAVPSARFGGPSAWARGSTACSRSCASRCQRARQSPSGN
jgi:hypothetical protein